MRLNADFSQRVAVHAASLPWVPSPTPGVSRRMLHREGGEVARATTIVRYEPGSHFPGHQHTGGEEFLVLHGVFQDEYANYPSGSYVRNPPGSFHTPGSEEGCILFVKLWQFDPQDRTETYLNIERMARLSDPRRPGVLVSPLHRDRREDVRVEFWAADAQMDLDMPHGGEILVLEGGFSEGGETFTSQSWLRLPPGSTLRARTGWRGAKVWVKLARLELTPASPMFTGAVESDADQEVKT